MERMVIRHLSGSKSNQVEEFPLSHFKEIVVGRDPSSAIKYDVDRDDLVGRQHAKISQDSSDPTQFLITDLSSRNGTYVNKQRIVGTAKLVPGDVVQFGAGGPEFQFDTEPRAMRPTREAISSNASLAGGSIPQTRVGDVTAPPPLPATTAASSTRVGKATVERMIAQNKGESRKYMVMLGGALMVIIAIVAGKGRRWGGSRFDLRPHQLILARTVKGHAPGQHFIK